MSNRDPDTFALEKFFEYSPDMLCIAGTDGYFKQVNPAFERTLGWATEELLSTPFLDFVHVEDVEATVREVDRLASGLPTVSFENRYRCADGSFKYLSWTAHPEPETGLLYAVARDVTQLRRARVLFRRVIESSPTAMVMVDDRGTIRLVNSATEELLAYDRKDLLGEPVEMLVPEQFHELHPGYRSAFLDELKARPMGEGRDLTAVRSDGVEFPVEVGLSPIQTDEGRFVLAAIVDLTERHRAAEELARSNEDLQRFASIASHDLQEPLRIVGGYMRLLEQRYRGQLDDEADQFISYAVDGADRMQLLISDLLSFSRVESQGSGFKEVDSRAALEWALTNLEAAIGEAGATVMHGDLPEVWGDATQLGQLFQNLIGNGIKFRGPQLPEIHIGANRQDGQWCFSVRDNGIGIEPKHHDRIFDIFQRLHHREDYEGTGIGLAICKRIVDRHGGRIWVDSIPGEHTTFFFTIPEPAAPTPA